ncbi:MAG: hypothetical protein Q9227_006415 [Pyrenula ochraceoflavens]
MEVAKKIISYADEYENACRQVTPDVYGTYGATPSLLQIGQSNLMNHASRPKSPHASHLSITTTNKADSMENIISPRTPPPKSTSDVFKDAVHARANSFASEPGNGSANPFGTSPVKARTGCIRRMSSSSAAPAPAIASLSPTIWTPVNDRTPGSSRRGSFSRATTIQEQESPTKDKGKGRVANVGELARNDRTRSRFSLTDIIHEDDEEHDSGAQGGMALSAREERNWTPTDDQLERETQVVHALGI